MSIAKTKGTGWLKDYPDFGDNTPATNTLSGKYTTSKLIPGSRKRIKSRRKKVIMKLKKIMTVNLLSIVCFLCSCKTLITTYDPYSYTQLSTLKVEVLNVMSKATEDYSAHAAEAEDVKIKIQKAYEYDTHKPKNEVMSAMWKFLYESLLSDEMEGITGHQHKKGFLNKWKADKKEGEIFVDEASSKIIAPMFDLIMELESKKLTKSTAESIFERIKQHLGGGQ